MKEKIKNFAVNNWDDIACLAIVAIAEYSLCKMYKNYLNKL